MHFCVGILVSNNSKHQVWVPRAPMRTSARVVPLSELLSLPAPPTGERLRLAVRLASSVLQLHKTEWLQERWGKKDIYLIQGDSSQPSPSLETPVVRRAFIPGPSVPEASIESCLIRCNQSLFSLGIVLIELWFWRSVESFQTDESQALVNSDTARYTIVRELIGRLYGEAGNNYGAIVQQCVYGIVHQEIRLEDNAFKNEVILRVLQPLEKDLERFYGKSIEEIFEDA